MDFRGHIKAAASTLAHEKKQEIQGMTIDEELKSRINTYKKNKTSILPEDLNGKYRAAFEKLKDDMRDLIDAYLREVIFSGLPAQVRQDVYTEIQSDIYKQHLGRKAGRAVFIYYDFDELEKIALEEKQRVQMIYERGMHEKKTG